MALIPTKEESLFYRNLQLRVEFKQHQMHHPKELRLALEKLPLQAPSFQKAITSLPDVVVDEPVEMTRDGFLCYDIRSFCLAL